ncbi:class I SAM-dependent rRNA methyltransferase [Kiloniella laminariae]|uniref:Class I SAM-dependent rRNA methyltransferase n=1 Tax=Kiloniella laminariae TaxID=454162 RepID=A0ABT4LKK1_9PROT|nr:class I SAM-dependent rRNA methyltransferase [Kiloniella laminariae]MCZ4281609.1 class I SAM-dependent rRNA methyltransferase [Kiloniella laminariae]
MSSATDLKLRPTIRLKPKSQRRLLNGYPWVFSNEIEVTPGTKELPAGTVVRIEAHDGQSLGTAIYNRLPLISARLLSNNAKAIIDEDFFAAILSQALSLREKLFDRPYYRLIHAEADGIPGTIIDRYGDTLVLQVNTAGIENLLPALLGALDRVLAPTNVLLRNDTPSRLQEGLECYDKVVKGQLSGPIKVIEHNATFFAELQDGQKTGWFFDQRDNRVLAAQFARDADVLDCYSFAGGFTVQAALAGAKSVTTVDRSQSALDLATMAATENGVLDRCNFIKAEVFSQLAKFAQEQKTFDLVIVDPPAFVKNRKDLQQGAKGYRKLARLAAQLVNPGGYLVIASCSHHMDIENFAEQVRKGLLDATRQSRLLYTRGAGPDHPVHPFLPESEYLKLQLYSLD